MDEINVVFNIPPINQTLTNSLVKNLVKTQIIKIPS